MPQDRLSRCTPWVREVWADVAHKLEDARIVGVTRYGNGSLQGLVGHE